MPANQYEVATRRLRDGTLDWDLKTARSRARWTKAVVLPKQIIPQCDDKSIKPGDIVAVRYLDGKEDDDAFAQVCAIRRLVSDSKSKDTPVWICICWAKDVGYHKQGKDNLCVEQGLGPNDLILLEHMQIITPDSISWIVDTKWKDGISTIRLTRSKSIKICNEIRFSPISKSFTAGGVEIETGQASPATAPKSKSGPLRTKQPAQTKTSDPVDTPVSKKRKRSAKDDGRQLRSPHKTRSKASSESSKPAPESYCDENADSEEAPTDIDILARRATPEHDKSPDPLHSPSPSPPLFSGPDVPDPDKQGSEVSLVSYAAPPLALAKTRSSPEVVIVRKKSGDENTPPKQQSDLLEHSPSEEANIPARKPPRKTVPKNTIRKSAPKKNPSNQGYGKSRNG